MSDVELPVLPLTLFEKYFLLDASEEFPMLVDGVFHFSGRFEPEKFEESLRECLERQPLFLRKIEKRNGRFYWVPRDEPFEIRYLEAPPDRNGAEWNEPIDLFRRNGLDLYVYHRENETKFYYRCHHICTDGAGFNRFLIDVFAVYAMKCGIEVNLPKPIDARRILDRDDFKPEELPEKIGFFRLVYETAKEIFRWMREKPVFIGRRRSDTMGGLARFGRKTYVIDAETVRRYRDKTRSVACTLNDFLMTAFFELLWKGETAENAAREQKGNRMRLMIPVNMRWPGSEDIPAANILSYVFLTKKKSDCLSGEKLLPVIHDEMQTIKDWQVGYMFLDGLRFFNRIPGGLRMMTGGKKCLASLVFSNTGPIERGLVDVFSKTDSGQIDIAGLRLDFVEAYAPCRPLTNLSVVGALHSGRLVLSCQYDRHYLSENELDQMIAEYESTLKRLSRMEGEIP